MGERPKEALRNYLNPMSVLTDHLPHQEEGYPGPTNERQHTGTHPLGDSRRGVADAPNGLERTVSGHAQGPSAGGP
jgi:hypothetical protein